MKFNFLSFFINYYEVLRYKSHRKEDAKSLKERLTGLRGVNGNEFHDLVGNALLEFMGFKQEESDRGEKVEHLLFYDFKLKVKSPVNEPSYIGENGFVQRRVNFTNPTLKARARVCTFYIGKMSFRNGRGIFGLININHDYGKDVGILRVEHVIEEITTRPEMKIGTKENRFRIMGEALEEIIRKKTIALGYREEGEEGKKVVKFKSLYVSPSYITGLIPNV